MGNRAAKRQPRSTAQELSTIVRSDRSLFRSVKQRRNDVTVFLVVYMGIGRIHGDTQRDPRIAHVNVADADVSEACIERQAQ